MSETMSTNSLLLMLAAALVYPPALKALLAAESRSQVALRRLWAVTLSFAGGSWLLAYIWAQELRSQIVSIAAIVCLMLALAVGYWLFSPSGCPKLAWLLIVQIGLLAYGTFCWAVMSLSAATTDATVESQTLALAYLVLAPTLAWALLPRPQAPKAGLFVILSALLTNAVAAWATLAFWGLMPSLPPRLEPAFAVLAWLLLLGVGAWIMQRVLATSAGATVKVGALRAAAGVPRLLGSLLSFVRGATPVLANWLQSGLSTAGNALAQLVQAAGRGLAGSPGAIWRGLVTIVGASGFALMALGRGIRRAAVSVVIVAPRSAARWLVAATRGVAGALVSLVLAAWHALLALGCGFRRAVVWLATVAPRSLARTVRAAARGIERGIVAVIGAGWYAITWLGRNIGRAAVWSVTVAPRSLARTVRAAALGIGRGIVAVAKAVWYASTGLGRNIGRAIAWLVTVAPRLAAHGVVVALRGLWRGLTRVGLLLWTGLVVLGAGAGRAGVWVATVVPRALARGALVSARGVRRGLSALAAGAWQVICRLAALVGGAATWCLTVAPGKAARAIAAAAAADWLCCRAAAFSISAGLVRAVSAVGRAGKWLVVTAPLGAAHWLLRAVRATWHGLHAAGRAVSHGLVRAVRAVVLGLVLAAHGLGRAIAWPVVVAAPAVAHGVVAGARAIWHGLGKLARGATRGVAWLVMVGLPSTGRTLVASARAVVRGLLMVMLVAARACMQAARAVGRGVVWLGVVGIPAAGRAIISGLRSVGLGALAVLHGLARALVAPARAIVRAPGRLVALTFAAGHSLARAAHTVAAAVLRLTTRAAAGMARLFTQVIPNFGRQTAARLSAVPSRVSANLRSGFSHQPHVRPRVVVFWGSGLFLAAAAATWLSWPHDGESVAAVPTVTPLPPNAIGISIVTNDTKAEWLGIVTDAFNKQGVKTSAGHDIIVQMIQESSPAPTVKKIVAGELQPAIWSPADISWVEQANALLNAQGKAPLVSETCPRIVYAPTGFMMWRPMAEALGWPDQPIGWKTIVELAADPQGWAKYGHPEWGQFKFGHTHPEQSSTGFNMLATLAYAAAGKTAGLTPEDVWSPAVVEAFRKVEKDTYHYGTSTRGLSTVMATRGPSYLHAATSTEVSMMKTAEVQKAVLRFPLAFIFPAEGVFWMDNPACLLDASWISAEQREAAKLYRGYLLGFEAQDKAVQIGLRPAASNVPLHAPIALDNGTDPRVNPQTVPPLANVSAETQKAIIDVFKETKKPATIVLVLDSSISMAGEPMRNAVAATRNFILRLAAGDRVELYSFNNEVAQVGPYGAAAEVRDEIAEALEHVRPGGQTALYDAICMAVRAAEAAAGRDRAGGEQRLYGVVVLSDGVENSSDQKDVFECLPTGEDVEGIKVLTIAYGEEADAKLLKKIAERTNGKTFKGAPATIDEVYLAISAEQ